MMIHIFEKGYIDNMFDLSSVRLCDWLCWVRAMGGVDEVSGEARKVIVVWVVQAREKYR